MIAAALIAVLTVAHLGPAAPAPGHTPPRLLATPAQDSVRFTASLSATAIRVGETVTLELFLETRGGPSGEITLPDLPPELEVVSTSEYSQFQFALPGGRIRSLRREIIIYAGEPGTFRIPPATAVVRGTVYRSPELILEVVAAGAPGAVGGGRSARPSDAPELGSNARGPGDEALIHAYLVPDTVYVNQQATLVSRIMVDEELQFRLHRSPNYHAPNPPPGLWTQDLRSPTQPRREFIDNRAYRVQEFQRAFFPLNPGTYVIPPARLDYRVRRSFRLDTESRTLASDSLVLVVLPLPFEGRPPNFSGAVGTLSISARLQPASVPAGEAAELVVEVEGIGNLEAIPAPALPEIDGVDIFPPAEEARIDVDQGTVRGTKRFTWILIPRRSGRIEIPALAYDFFDPSLHRYRTAYSDPLTLVSTGGDGAPATTPPDNTLRDLKLEPARDARRPAFPAPFLALLLAVPLLALLPLAIRRGRQRRHEPSPRARQKELHARLQRLQQATSIGDEEVYNELAAIIRAAAALVIGVEEGTRATPHSIARELEAAGVPSATVRALADLLTRIEGARYRPDPPVPEERHALIAEAGHLLAVLERHQYPGRPRSRGGSIRSGVAAGTLAALLFAGGVASAHSASGRQDLPEYSSFSRGLELYRAGDFDAAARAFAEHLRDHPGDPHAWFNLGNAHFRDDARGHALHAWLNALTLAPRDRDIRHNLGLAGADPELVRAAAPALPFSPRERTYFAVILWLAAAGTLAAFCTTHNRTFARLAATLGIAAVLVGATTILPLGNDDVAIALPDELPLRVAPDHRADQRYHIPAGTRLRIREHRGEWLRVATDREREEGWVEERFVGRLQTTPRAPAP